MDFEKKYSIEVSEYSDFKMDIEKFFLLLSMLVQASKGDRGAYSDVLKKLSDMLAVAKEDSYIVGQGE